MFIPKSPKTIKKSRSSPKDYSFNTLNHQNLGTFLVNGRLDFQGFIIILVWVVKFCAYSNHDVNNEGHQLVTTQVKTMPNQVNPQIHSNKVSVATKKEHGKP